MKNSTKHQFLNAYCQYATRLSNNDFTEQLIDLNFLAIAENALILYLQKVITNGQNLGWDSQEINNAIISGLEISSSSSANEFIESFIKSGYKHL